MTRKKSVPFECSSFLPVIRFETKQNPTKSKQINQSDALSHRKNREAVLLLLSRNKGKEEPPGNGRFQEKKTSNLTLFRHIVYSVLSLFGSEFLAIIASVDILRLSR